MVRKDRKIKGIKEIKAYLKDAYFQIISRSPLEDLYAK